MTENKINACILRNVLGICTACDKRCCEVSDEICKLVYNAFDLGYIYATYKV